MSSGLMLVWDQVHVEQHPMGLRSTEHEFLIRGEPNQVLRWSLTLLIVIAHVARIFYFSSGYFMVTAVCLYLFLGRLYYYILDDPSTYESKASDSTSISYRIPDGQWHSEPLISALLKHKLSPKEFNKLILRIVEFKFWYVSTKITLFAVLLSYITFLKCTYFGTEMLWVGVFNVYVIHFVCAMIKKCRGGAVVTCDDDTDKSNIDDAPLLV